MTNLKEKKEEVFLEVHSEKHLVHIQIGELYPSPCSFSTLNTAEGFGNL